MKKRFLQFGMTAKAVMIALLLGVAGMTKAVAQNFDDGYLKYTVLSATDRTVSVTGHVLSASTMTGSLIIPSSVMYDGNEYSVITIARRAFYSCNNLTSVVIPNTVTDIQTYAFFRCTGLNSVYYTGDIEHWCGISFDDEYITNPLYYAHNLYIDNELVTDLVIPETISVIKNKSFNGASCLTSVIIPNSVTSIGESAFGGCTNLISMTIPTSVTEIYNSSFYNTGWYNNQPDGILYKDGICLGYKGQAPTGSLIIDEGTRVLAGWAFSNCNELTSVTIPNSMTSIVEGAFVSNSGYGSFLEQISVCLGNTVYDSRNNCNAIIETYTNTLLYGCMNTIIPETVTSIGDKAFIECWNLMSIEIPNSVISIGNSAFSSCMSLNSVTLGNMLTHIGNHAFWGAGCLNSIQIPNSVSFIGDYAFDGCMSLTSLEIPSSVSFIGSGAFGYCPMLEQIVVSSENGIYDSRENCNAIIETITNTVIAGCKNTFIPDGITSIGDRVFSGCFGLTFIEIPNSVTSIGRSAFFETGLTSLEIPNSVTFIGSEAFGGEGFVSILLRSIVPPSTESYPFYGTVIYVPYESINTYKTDSNWSNYSDIILGWTQNVCSGFGSTEGHWRFIASPLAESTAPTEIDDMLPTTGTYDLYCFDQTENAEWRNYKANNFNLVNGQGYLYANAEDVNLVFKGTFNEDETKNVGLVYDADATFSGWNLVGNPFPVSAYANKSYYTMNEDGSAIEPVAVSMETAIPACTGVMVKAENTGESVTFSKTAPETAVNQGVLQIVLSQLDPELVEGSKGGVSTSSAAVLDKAIVSFNEGDELGKFVFNKDNAKLYIRQGNEEYAIAYAAKQGEMPLNFEATENGEYTISIKAENAEFDYLHLIDNLTGADIDLLPLCKGGKEDFQPATYTFTAKTTDYASRFRLVFSVSGDADGDDDAPFAFISNGSIIVSDANATLQIVDMTGHIIVSADVARNISTNGMAQGVYVLRLIKGDEVKTQRIVVE